MPTRVSRNPMNPRRRTVTVAVPVSVLDPEAGAVTVTLAEMPLVKLDEIRDEQGLVSEESRAASAEYEALRSAPLSEGETPDQRRQRLAPLRARAAQAKRLVVALYEDICRWCVVGHLAEDLVDDVTGESLPYSGQEVEFDGGRWSVVSEETLSVYRAVGEAFVLRLANSALSHQIGEVPPSAQQIWEAAKAKAEAKESPDPLG